MKCHNLLINILCLISLFTANILAKKHRSYRKKLIVATPQPLLKREDKITLTTSLIIPCCALHVGHLYQLLELYEQQTCLPDEVIISLSECNNAPATIIESIQKKSWMFPVVLIQCEKKQYAGENRNNACSQAKGDILILQDADDIPHPQRIEIIKYAFETYKIEHLMHHYMMIQKEPQTMPFTPIYPEKIRFKKCTLETDRHSCTNGNIALTKELFHQIQWSNKPRGQDTEFNKKVLQARIPSLLVSTVLLYYRIFLSSQNKC